VVVNIPLGATHLYSSDFDDDAARYLQDRDLWNLFLFDRSVLASIILLLFISHFARFDFTMAAFTGTLQESRLVNSTIHRHTIDSVVFCFWLSLYLFLDTQYIKERGGIRQAA
jgi:hypothetical protein